MLPAALGCLHLTLRQPERARAPNRCRICISAAALANFGLKHAHPASGQREPLQTTIKFESIQCASKFSHP